MPNTIRIYIYIYTHTHPKPHLARRLFPNAWAWIGMNFWARVLVVGGDVHLAISLGAMRGKS